MTKCQKIGKIKETEMMNKCMKRHSPSLAIMKMLIKVLAMLLFNTQETGGPSECDNIECR